LIGSYQLVTTSDVHHTKRATGITHANFTNAISNTWHGLEVAGYATVNSSLVNSSLAPLISIAHHIGVRCRGTGRKLGIGLSVFLDAEFYRVKTVTQHESQHGRRAAPGSARQSADSG
jgi:hypothetical protein